MNIKRYNTGDMLITVLALRTNNIGVRSTPYIIAPLINNISVANKMKIVPNKTVDIIFEEIILCLL